jgi:hypothetical protein
MRTGGEHKGKVYKQRNAQKDFFSKTLRNFHKSFKYKDDHNVYVVGWMETKILGGRDKEGIKQKVREEAITALKDSDLTEVLELLGIDGNYGATSAALKAVLADQITEYAMGAMREAKKRGVRVGAATIIIAASESR